MIPKNASSPVTVGSGHAARPFLTTLGLVVLYRGERRTVSGWHYAGPEAADERHGGTDADRLVLEFSDGTKEAVTEDFLRQATWSL